MNQKEFKFQIERLRKNYGERSYPQESVLAIWEGVKNASSEVFCRAVTKLLADNPHQSFPPGLSKINSEMEKAEIEMQQSKRNDVRHVEENFKPLSGEVVSSFFGELLKKAKL